MEKPEIEYFNKNAPELARQYNALDREKVHADVLALLPPGRVLKVLDLGAGSGADAAMFAEKGHRVTAVEPAQKLRQEGQKTFQNKNINWKDDVLPDLSEAVREAGPYDIVLAANVLQYLDRENRIKSLKSIFSLVAEKGLVTIQYPTPASREYQHTIEHNEITGVLDAFHEAAGVTARFDIVMDKSEPDFSGRKALDGGPLSFRTLVLRRIK